MRNCVSQLEYTVTGGVIMVNWATYAEPGPPQSANVDAYQCSPGQSGHSIPFISPDQQGQVGRSARSGGVSHIALDCTAI